MALSEGYAVLKGRAIGKALERDDKQSPHYQILVEAGGARFRVPVNVKSVKQPFDLLMLIEKDFRHPITAQLSALQEGLTEIPLAERKAGGVALDFIRSNLFAAEAMRPVRADLPGRENDVNDFLDLVVVGILNNRNVDLYAFGEPFGPESQKDKVFAFQPARGLHNIHMNQGNGEAQFKKENGVYQDGALLIHYRDEKRWAAFFSAFQSQAFHTDDATGNPLPPDGETKVATGLKIVAAKVNPIGEDAGQETVILINTSAASIPLDGWVLSDRRKRKMALKGELEAGHPLLIQLSGKDVQLDNTGGTLTLLDPKGLKVDGVSYTKEQALNPGQTIVF